MKRFKFRNPVAREAFNRFERRLLSTSSMDRMSDWMIRSTRLRDQAWSFRDHEYQIMIVDDPAHSLCGIKPSQVGFSEILVRTTLGFLDTHDGATSIYTMPTSREALGFVKARFDPVVEEAPSLKRTLAPGSDSAGFKRFGRSQFHAAGTFGKAIISVPADLLVHDELDFSNPEAVATAESRLSHSRFLCPHTGERGYRRKFSTPTVPKYGVHKEWLASDRKRRLVKCQHCNEWSWPDLLTQGVIEGWDRPITEITYLDVEALEESGSLETARILCPGCGKPISQSNLGPSYREWVAERERPWHSGYWVSPFDLPSYHTPRTLLLKLKHYKGEIGHWYNFGLGQPYADASNSVVDSVVEANQVVRPIPPETALSMGVSGCLIGLDVGKTSWILVGYPQGRKLEVIWAERIILRGEEGPMLRERVMQLLEAYGVYHGGMDSLPYTDSISAISAVYSTVYPCMYSLRDTRLPASILNENDGFLAMNRNKTLDQTVAAINSGRVLWPEASFREMATVRAHLQGEKKISPDPDKEKDADAVAEWVKVGENHYLHAMNYLWTAYSNLLEVGGVSVSPPIGFVEADIGGRLIEAKRVAALGRR